MNEQTTSEKGKSKNKNMKKTIPPFKLKSINELLACGKSTVDGSYVKGIYKKEMGINYIDTTPVHPWSIGFIPESFPKQPK